MTIHPAFSSRFHLLDGIESFESAFADPEQKARLDEFMLRPGLLRFLPEQVEAINRNYLGGPVTRADGYAFPALADLTGLCRTLVVNAEYDDLRSSGTPS